MVNSLHQFISRIARDWSRFRNAVAGLVLISFFLITIDLCRIYNSYSDDVWKLYVSRLLITNVARHAFFLVLLYFKKTKKVVVRFLTEPSHPNNLAIFRLVFFWMLFRPTWARFIALSTIPEGLRNASWHLPHWFLDYLPINEAWMATAITLFRFFCFLSFIGLFTRPAIILAFIFGFYVLGAPQYLGKLDHYHHLIWFLAILSFSRCGDALSIDALIRAWQQRRNGRTYSPGPSIEYGLPLRFIGLLIGIIYFFPGFWKIWGGGLEWVSTDHLKNVMYFKWMNYPDFTPLFRIDRYPLLLKISAAMVVTFELSFVFLILFPRLRPFAILGGLFFHYMNFRFLNISFLSLVYCYAALIDWQAIFQRLKRKKLKAVLPATDRSLDVRQQWTWGLAFCGAFLIFGNIWFGLGNMHSWPLSCYPTFQYVKRDPYTSRITTEIFDSKNNKIEYDTKKIAGYFSPDRLHEVSLHIAFERDPQKAKARLEALGKFFLQSYPEITEAAYFRLYQEDLDMTPENLDRNPVTRKKIYELILPKQGETHE